MEHASGLVIGENEDSGNVDNHACDGIGLEGGRLKPILNALLARGGGRRLTAAVIHLGENAPAEVDGREKVAVREQELGLAHEKETPISQREVKAGQDLRLCLSR